MTGPAPRWLGWLENRLYWALIGALALGAIGYDVVLERQQAAYSSCIAAYNDAYSAVAQIRSQAFEEQTAATTEVLTTAIDAATLPPAQQKTTVRAAVVKYRKTIASVQAERTAHPLPESPKDRC